MEKAAEGLVPSRLSLSTLARTMMLERGCRGVGAAIDGAAVVVFLDLDRGEAGSQDHHPVPYPGCQNLRGGVLKAGDVVQIAVVHDRLDAVPRLGDHGEVHQHAIVTDRPGEGHFDLKVVAMKPMALMVLRGHW